VTESIVSKPDKMKENDESDKLKLTNDGGRKFLLEKTYCTQGIAVPPYSIPSIIPSFSSGFGENKALATKNLTSGDTLQIPIFFK
jgi:hypothetical protein